MKFIDWRLQVFIGVIVKFLNYPNKKLTVKKMKIKFVLNLLTNIQLTRKRFIKVLVASAKNAQVEIVTGQSSL